MKQLGRVSRQRKALLKALSVGLVEHGKIRTTLAKAKYLRPYIEKVLTNAKSGGRETLRELRKDFDVKTAKDIMNKWSPLFAKRNGGYTRIIKLNARTGDASPMAYIEFVEKPVEKAEKKDKTEKEKKVKKSPKKSEEKVKKADS